MKINLLIPFAALALAGCYRNVDETVAELDCGDMTLHLEVKEFRGPPDMPLSRFPRLSMSKSGLPPVRVDDLSHRWRVELHTLLEPGAEFRLIAGPEGAAGALSAKNRTDVFVDPETFSYGDYSSIAACLQGNINKIDAAYDRPMFDGDYVPGLRLRSVIYKSYEDGYGFCGDKVLGKRFDCAGGAAYIKTVLPRGLQLCRTGSRETNAKDFIGKISADQKSVQLRGPGSTGPADHTDYGLKTLAGPDWRAFYRTCRDPGGKTIFDYFRDLPWQEGPGK